MPKAEIIAIGTELLLGEMLDTNTQSLARYLREVGIDLYRSTIVGDNATRIAEIVREATARAQIIITSGGLGPTVDDPTRKAVSMALGVDLEYRPDLWEQIEQRFQRFGRPATENNRQQAYIPQGSTPITNPVGTAPGFIAEQGENVIISLPGPPKELARLWVDSVSPYLTKKYALQGIIKALVLHTSGTGESQVDEWISDLEKLSNPTVGLLAHAGQVDVRITAKASSLEEADNMIGEMAQTLRTRLGDSIYGVDTETLEEVVIKKLSHRQQHLALLEIGSQGEIGKRFLNSDPHSEFVFITQKETAIDIDDLVRLVGEQKIDKHVHSSLVTYYQPGNEKQTLHIAWMDSGKPVEIQTRSYGGPPESGLHWAANCLLDFLRRSL